MKVVAEKNGIVNNGKLVHNFYQVHQSLDLAEQFVPGKPRLNQNSAKSKLDILSKSLPQNWSNIIYKWANVQNNDVLEGILKFEHEKDNQR